MSANKTPWSFLLLLSLALLHGNLANSIRAPSIDFTATQPLMTRPRIIEVTGLDYDEEFTEVPSPTPIKDVDAKLCSYDACLDQQTPCAQLAASSSCLCPGITGPHVPPGVPLLKKLTQGEAGAVVEWCAPDSWVTHYKIVVEGRNVLMPGEMARREVLAGLPLGATVCVEAVNGAGASGPSQESCAQLAGADSSVTMRSIVIGGGVAALLLLSLALILLLKYKVCRKGRGDDGHGLGNPSYRPDSPM